MSTTAASHVPATLSLLDCLMPYPGEAAGLMADTGLGRTKFYRFTRGELRDRPPILIAKAIAAAWKRKKVGDPLGIGELTQELLLALWQRETDRYAEKPERARARDSGRKKLSRNR